jgi:ActR/RegA family two-component response regulator
VAVKIRTINDLINDALKELLEFTREMCEEKKILQAEAYDNIITAVNNMRKGVVKTLPETQ